MLLALQLQRAGLAFVSAKAIHRPGCLRVGEVVCANQEDADRVNVWADIEGVPVKARVATAEELEESKKWEECF